MKLRYKLLSFVLALLMIVPFFASCNSGKTGSGDTENRQTQETEEKQETKVSRIPTYVRNSEMVGDTLEMLSFYSENVNAAFYEKLLGKQVSDMSDDARMLKIVWDGVGTDFGQTYYWAFLKTDICV